MNKHILLVMKYVMDSESVTRQELADNSESADTTYAAACDAAYAASYGGANTEKHLDSYFDRSGEDKQDYIDAIGES